MLGDGVDRSAQVRTADFARRNPGRVVVYQDWPKWYILRGLKLLADFPTHAEAIAYADKQARS